MDYGLFTNSSEGQNFSVMVSETPLPDYELYYLKDQLTMVRSITSRIVAPTIAFVGIMGNIINIVVLTRRWMRSSTNCYLTVLAIYDTLYLLIATSLFFFRVYPDIRYTMEYTYYFWIARPLSNVCSNTGTWLTVTFTVERYIGVCHPMKGRVLCTVERARYIIAAVCALAFLSTLPDFFDTDVVRPDVNATKYEMTRNHGHEILTQIGYYWINPTVFTFIPLILLAVFNSLLIYSVMEASKLRKSMANIEVTATDNRRERQQREQQRITIMLISVVVVFFLCQLPSACLLIVQKVYDDVRKTEKLRHTIAGNVFNVFVMVNSAINFLLYSLFSTKFRNTFKRIFCRCCQDRQSRNDGLFSEIATAHPTAMRSNRPSLCVQFNNVNISQSRSPLPDRAVNTSKNGYLQIQNKQEDSV
ncbi:FMRFamide receptor-like [Lineus longissimus]|uniref:FMRFamide receptor-like n=1 Tax=Lineus longissimus TaxID=88925 RepID=UPI002B4E7D08